MAKRKTDDVVERLAKELMCIDQPSWESWDGLTAWDRSHYRELARHSIRFCKKEFK